MPSDGTPPQVGEVVIYDGEPHQLTAIAEKTADFTDGTTARTVGLHDLELLAPGQWGVIGRTAKRPRGQRLAVVTTPAAPTGEG